MSDNARDNPGVIAHPPIIYGVGLAAGIASEAFWPWGRGLFAAAPAWVAIGVVLAVLGAALLVYAASRFFRAGTNVPTHLPSTTLVTWGPYRWSRNPIYVALTLIYSGLALAIGAWSALALLPLVLVVMRYGVIAREELYLEHKFGTEYADYKKRVRRWI